MFICPKCEQGPILCETTTANYYTLQRSDGLAISEGTAEGAKFRLYAGHCRNRNCDYKSLLVFLIPVNQPKQFA